ncbi:MAG: hypothetical protein GX548_07405 [Lentisphaerae bacterium]|nr:hypothetical protein [Lentisphaerota bacterium]
MNELIDLIFNPITIIALLLALFFILMAYMRNLGSRKERTEASSGEAKPYRVSDPYAAPKPPPPPAPPRTTLDSTPVHPPSPDTSEPDSGRKFFRQFGPGPDGPATARADAEGYVWE